MAGVTDVSKHTTMAQLKALYANRYGNSSVGSNGKEYNTDSIVERMNELAIKQIDAMIKEREEFENDINNSYPANWDIENINEAQVIKKSYDKQCNIKFNLLNNLNFWQNLTSESKNYWIDELVSL